MITILTLVYGSNYLNHAYAYEMDAVTFNLLNTKIKKNNNDKFHSKRHLI